MPDDSTNNFYSTIETTEPILSKEEYIRSLAVDAVAIIFSHTEYPRQSHVIDMVFILAKFIETGE